MILETLLDTSFGFVPCRFSRPSEICHPDVLVLKSKWQSVLVVGRTWTCSQTFEWETAKFFLYYTTVTHLEKQWAADITHSLLMREPPQTWLPNLCRLTCQGQLPAGASSPPTILVFRGVMPHTGKEISQVRFQKQRLLRHILPSFLCFDKMSFKFSRYGS